MVLYFSIQKDLSGVTSSLAMEEQIKKLTSELQKLQEIGELEKRTNVLLESQIEELKEKLSTKRIQEDLQANVTIAELKKKINELQAQLDGMEKSYQKNLEGCRKEQGRNTCFSNTLKTIQKC